MASFTKKKRKKGKNRREVIKKIKEGRKKNREGKCQVRREEREAGEGEGEDMCQHRKFGAKFLIPLGGKAELREGNDSHKLVTCHEKEGKT